MVPGHVLFTIDFRQPHEEVIERLGNQVEGICKPTAKGCDVRVVGVWRSKPIVFEGLVPDTILAATERLGLPHMHIFSGAGHDAGYLSHVCPTGMIFVPCERGISHQRDRERDTVRPRRRNPRAGRHTRRPGERLTPREEPT